MSTSELRKDISIQKSSYNLSPEERHNILGYDLYEIDISDYSNHNNLNSFLIYEKSFCILKDEYNIVDYVSDNYALYELHIVSDLLRRRNVPKLFIVYIIAILAKSNHLLYIEFYRYLKTFPLTYIIDFDICDLANIAANYYYFLYEINVLTNENLKKFSKIETNTVVIMMGHLLKMILRDKIMKKEEKYKIINFIKQYEDNIEFLFMDIIISTGDKNMIKWLVKYRNIDKDDDESNIPHMLWIAYRFDKTKVLIEILEQNGHNLIELVGDDAKDANEIEFSTLTSLASFINIKEIVKLYKEDEYSYLREWIEHIVLNQV